MSAQDYTDKCGDLSLQRKGEDQITSVEQTQGASTSLEQNMLTNTNQITATNDQLTSSNVIIGRIRKAKGKRVEKKEEKDDGEESYEESKEETSHGNQQEKKKTKVNAVEHLINSPVERGVLTGLG
ncbi:uncharacterized protein MELLADRAFT_66036 [Melampsora larici-populina 98AG31]|uniref:Uncharacterized protein n=1 Tax=Melampsora larici-populina (strain 98AG31 / pathotype 3-4-7) TaxID=747676 RepID=F4RXN1_MELLP|nr:uncharacterized protein MELLADRAFT_66036 [Melampsora larici-populina 98AG31]EGG02754.1 hypothetical protein MELLADRAFT_66036 [Melampsora larici-populina 98AG31]